MISRISVIVFGMIACFCAIAQSQSTATIITEPKSNMLYVQVGKSFTMVCEQYNCEEVMWYKSKDSQPLEKLSFTAGSNFDETSLQIPNPGSQCTIRSTFTKSSVTKEDEGNYKCRTTSNTQGYIKPVVVIDGTEQANVRSARNKELEQVQGVDAELETEGEDTVFLQCVVSGITEIGPWVWYHNNTQIKPDNVKYFVHDINTTLEIRNADHKDIGVYNCTLTKDAVDVWQAVNLFSKPYVESFEKSKNLVQGDNLVLDAKVYAHPMPTVSWLKDGLPLDTSDTRISLNASMGVENASLRIVKLDFADRAEYTIVTNNNLGTGNATILVRVKDKLAALWPFLGIVCEVVILCTIIFIYERRRAKRMEEEEIPEEAGHLTNSNDHKKDDVRQRKV